MAIRYYKLFDLLNRRGMKKTDLLTLANLSSPTLAKLSKGETITTEVIDRICTALGCQPENIMEVVTMDVILSRKQATALFGNLSDPKYKLPELTYQQQPIKIERQPIAGNVPYPAFTFKNAAEMEYYYNLINSLPEETPIAMRFPPDVAEKEILCAINDMLRACDKPSLLEQIAIHESKKTSSANDTSPELTIDVPGGDKPSTGVRKSTDEKGI